MKFISNLPKIMTERKLTYEDLQHLAKVSPDTVARCCDERIATCKLLTLGKIAKALQIDVKLLFDVK